MFITTGRIPLSVPENVADGLKGSRENWLYGGGIVLASLLWLLLTGFTNVPPHEFTKSQCTDCHFTIPSDNDTRPFRFTGPVNGLCLGCHEGVETVSHNLCVKPSFKVESSLPLEKGCGVTCATCHEPHARATDPDTGKKTYMLRTGSEGFWHCEMCHKSELSATDDLTHRPSMNRAHGYSRFKVVGFGDDLDPLTYMCLSCHDAPGKPETTVPGSEVWAHGNNTYLPHKVGIVYEDVAWDNRNLRLADRDESLPLFDGKLGCCTCHDPYKPGGGMQLRLKSGEDKSMLCAGCHLDR